MKIAFLTPEYPHFNTGSYGGIGVSVKGLSRALIDNGCQVRVLVYGQKEDNCFEDSSIVVQQIQNIKFKGLSWYLTRKKIERIIDKLYFEKAIDLVEAPDWTGITSFIKPKQCPVVIRLHGSDTYFCHLDNRPVKWLNKFHEKRALKNANGLISVSQFTANVTNEIFKLNKEFTIIPNCIDTKLFEKKEHVKSDEGMILYFGTLIRKKGLLELPEIFNLVHKVNQDVELILVGNDSADIKTGSSSTWELMKPLFHEASFKKVRYLGAVDYSKIQDLIKEASVCVFPTFAEALPVSWLEAMAMEKAIVASNIGWAQEMIKDGEEGFLVHPTHHEQYAERILELLHDLNKRIQFGTAVREKVKTTFSHDLVARQSVEFYKTLIA